MHTPSLPIALVTLLCATSCVTSKLEVAGQVPLSGGGTRTLQLCSSEPGDLSLRLWNRGPGVVMFRSFGANGHVHLQSTLGDDEIRMQEVADLTAVELIADQQGASVLYAIRGRGSVTVSVRDGAHSSGSRRQPVIYSACRAWRALQSVATYPLLARLPTVVAAASGATPSPKMKRNATMSGAHPGW